MNSLASSRALEVVVGIRIGTLGVGVPVVVVSTSLVCSGCTAIHTVEHADLVVPVGCFSPDLAALIDTTAPPPPSAVSFKLTLFALLTTAVVTAVVTVVTRAVDPAIVRAVVPTVVPTVVTAAVRAVVTAVVRAVVRAAVPTVVTAVI